MSQRPASSMPPRTAAWTKQAPFSPPADAATFRDLLLFEERLKTNAARLKKQKARYQLFLFALLSFICLLVSDLLLHSFFVSYPVNFFLDPEPGVHPLRPPVWIPHPYVIPGMLLIAVTTLVLFFASGTYAEKIGYANRYVPSANRALRSFNMHFNPRSSSTISLPYPFSLLFGRKPAPVPPPPRPILKSRSSTDGKSSESSSTSSMAGIRGAPLQPLPPTSNPRGELIFSSRIPPTFRESYERYRASFERRRAEKLAARRWWWVPSFSWRRPSDPPAKEDSGVLTEPGKERMSRGRSSSPGSSLVPTPANSRRPSRSPSRTAPPLGVEVKREDRGEEKRKAVEARKKKDDERRKLQRTASMKAQVDLLEERLGNRRGQPQTDSSMLEEKPLGEQAIIEERTQEKGG